MDRAPEQENTARRRAQILDADYVRHDEAPVVPGSRASGAGGSRGIPAVTAVTLCLALLALGLAVSRGDGRGRTEDEAPWGAAWEERVITAAARTETFPAPREGTASLGVAGETVSAPVAAYYSMKDAPMVPGVQIFALDRDGPAARAGLLQGDVITAVDGGEIRTQEELADCICEHLPGESVLLTVYRQGETLELQAVLDVPTPRDETDFFHNLD